METLRRAQSTSRSAVVASDLWTADVGALATCLALSETNVSIPPKRALKLAEDLVRIRDALFARSATERITGMPMIKALKDQRDECAEVLREIMAKLREQFGERMDQSIDPHAWTLGWQTLTARADAILTKCPSYTQQLRNLAEGLGMTYEELCAAADRLKDKATNSVPDRNATP